METIGRTMTPYLVTGGGGFIGSHVVDALLEAGHQVRVLDAFISGDKSNLPQHENLEIIEGDIRNWKTVHKAVEGVVGVIHTSGQTSMAKSIENPRVSTEINILGFTNLLDALRATSFTGRLIYTSCFNMYGNHAEDKPLKEEDVSTEHVTPYAFEKWMMEKQAGLYNRSFGLQSLGLRLFSVYGERQQEHHVIPSFIRKIQNVESIEVHGDGEQTRDFIYVKDVVEIIMQALSNNINGVLNVGSGKRVTINMLIEALAEVCNTEIVPVKLAEQPGGIKHAHADIRRLRKVFDKLPRTPLKEGLKKCLGDTFMQAVEESKTEETYEEPPQQSAVA
jgi:UDP-glucose 4-epimerase